MRWDWSRVNPKGLSASMAKLLVASQLLAGLGTLLAALTSSGPIMWLCVAVTVFTWSVATVLTAIAAGRLRR